MFESVTLFGIGLGELALVVAAGSFRDGPKVEVVEAELLSMPFCRVEAGGDAKLLVSKLL